MREDITFDVSCSFFYEIFAQKLHHYGQTSLFCFDTDREALRDWSEMMKRYFSSREDLVFFYSLDS